MLAEQTSESYLSHPTPSPAPACTVCAGTRGLVHHASEKMFGFGGEFVYFECSTCGCLQILAPPSDLSRYYPDYYYSYTHPRNGSRYTIANGSLLSAVRRWAGRHRNFAQLYRANPLWRLIAMLRPRRDVARLKGLLGPVGRLRADARILDVGSGAGDLLCELADAGFTNLLGVDPFLRESISIGRSVRILATQLDAVRGEFDLVMFNHSLEHMPDQASALRSAATLLHTNGICTIAIPVAGSDPWSRYGTDWVGLDAPRHLFLHTEQSLRQVALRAGLHVYHIVWDTSEIAYWGSELYRRGITLYDDQRGCFRQPDMCFTQDEVSEFARCAADASVTARAGAATFYLRKHDARPL